MSTTLERPALDTTRKVPTAKDTGTLLKGQKRTGWALLAPALLHSAVFIVIPVVAVLVLSLTDYSFGDTWSWVGFGNYADLFRDVDFQASLWHTVLYAIIVYHVITLDQIPFFPRYEHVQ